jgi:NAD-dependent DNA ligase
MIKRIKRFFSKKTNNKSESNTKSNTKFKDETIVFTGIRDQDLQKQIEDQGGKITTSISKNTTILITSDNPDTGTEKYKKAKQLGIKIYTISEFKKIL